MTMSREDRIRANTASDLNARLDDAMRDRLFRYAASSDEEISARMEALDREWDIEHYVEVLAPTLALGGTALALLHSRNWLLVPGLVLGFLMQHSLQGACAPLVALRRMGVRTQREIDEERIALKALRGDFAGLPPDAPLNRVARVDAVLEAVRL